MLRLSDLYDIPSLEAIDFQFNSALGTELEKEVTKFRALNKITQIDLDRSNICQLVKDTTGIKLELHLCSGLDAWMNAPQIDKNNVIINDDKIGRAHV